MLEDAVLAIVQDEEDHGEVVMRRRPQGLDAVHRRAVPGQRDHRAIRMGQLHSQRTGQRLADAAAARADIGARTVEVDGAGEVDARGDGFVDHDGIAGQGGLDLRHEARHGDRRLVPALGRPRALGAGVLGLERAKRVMATGRRVAEAGVRAPLDGRAERRQGGARVAYQPHAHGQIVSQALGSRLDLYGDGTLG